MNKPSDYHAMRIWNASSGSFPYYWKNEQEKAAEDNAPLDALYYSDTEKRWITMADLRPDHPFHVTYVTYDGKGTWDTEGRKPNK